MRGPNGIRVLLAPIYRMVSVRLHDYDKGPESCLLNQAGRLSAACVMCHTTQYVPYYFINLSCD